MKRIFAFLSVLVLILSLASCKDSNKKIRTTRSVPSLPRIETDPVTGGYRDGVDTYRSGDVVTRSGADNSGSRFYRANADGQRVETSPSSKNRTVPRTIPRVPGKPVARIPRVSRLPAARTTTR